MKVDTTQGHLTKPKACPGYRIELHSCECGCKGSNYYYVKIVHKKRKPFIKITVNAEFLFQLNSNREWVNNIPDQLPAKTRPGEKLIFVDKKGNTFECGADFELAEKLKTYPVKIYRLCSVTSAAKMQQNARIRKNFTKKASGSKK